MEAGGRVVIDYRENRDQRFHLIGFAVGRRH